MLLTLVYHVCLLARSAAQQHLVQGSCCSRPALSLCSFAGTTDATHSSEEGAEPANDTGSSSLEESDAAGMSQLAQ